MKSESRGKSVHTRMHTYVHTYIHTYKHIYIHTYVYTYIHTNINTYIHTYKRTDIFKPHKRKSQIFLCLSSKRSFEDTHIMYDISSKCIFYADFDGDVYFLIKLFLCFFCFSLPTSPISSPILTLRSE